MVTMTEVPDGRRTSLLDGVTVLDLTRFLAGPFGTMVLADMGATVIKVEQLTGDTTRYQPPYYFEGDSAYFLAINRNKQSISLDIRSEGGRRVLERLIARSDIMIDNLRAPQRQKLRLSWEHVEKINPRIISCSVTGFGSDGPYADRPAYDIIVEALGGVMGVTGPEGGPSVRAGVPIGDITAGLYAAIGVLGGLAYRDHTGRGQHIDVSMLDAQVSLLSYLAQYYFIGGLVAQHQGRAHVSIPTYNTFATKDGREIVVAANTQEMWTSLCHVLGRQDLLEDPRFVDNPTRLTHREELLEILREEFARCDVEWLHDALVEHQVPAAPINSIDAALADPQVRHREMVVKTTHRGGKDFLTLGTAIKTDDPAGAEFSSPPALGGDTQQILDALGFTGPEISELAAARAIKLDGQ
jgi:CoA:oxalate CoA-transferase